MCLTVSDGECDKTAGSVEDENSDNAAVATGMNLTETRFIAGIPHCICCWLSACSCPCKSCSPCTWEMSTYCNCFYVFSHYAYLARSVTLGYFTVLFHDISLSVSVTHTHTHTHTPF